MMGATVSCQKETKMGGEGAASYLELLEIDRDEGSGGVVVRFRNLL